MTTTAQLSMLPTFDTGGAAFGDHVFYGVLDENQLGPLRSQPAYRWLGRHSILQAMGKVPEEVFTLCSGWAFRYILLPDGRRQILSFFLPGDLISPQALHARPLWFSVQAMTDVTVAAFNRKKLSAATFAHEPLRERFAAVCTGSYENQDRRVVSIGRLPAVERLGLLLAPIETRFAALGQVAPDGSFPFALRQEHIADALGLTRVHVSRVLGQLRADGVIAFEEGRMSLLDRQWVKALARLPSVASITADGLFIS